MTRRPSLLILVGGFVVAAVVGFVLAILDLSFTATLATGLAVTAVLTTVALVLELLHQRRPERPGGQARELRT
jgi:Kef-type K+ transport system membrane component KefB